MHAMRVSVRVAPVRGALSHGDQMGIAPIKVLFLHNNINNNIINKNNNNK